MNLFVLSMKAHDSLVCKCCDNSIPVYRFKKNIKAFRKKMDLLIKELESNVKPYKGEVSDSKKILSKLKLELLKVNLEKKQNKSWNSLTSIGSEELMEKIRNDLHYYSDRWSYTRKEIIKLEYKIFNQMYNYYEKFWDKK